MIEKSAGRLNMIARLRARQELKFFGVLHHADRPLAIAWWSLLILRGLLPAAFAIVMGVLVGAVQGGRSLVGPLVAVGIVFIALQVLAPLHQTVSANLGDRTAAWLYDRLDRGHRPPAGHGSPRGPRAGQGPDRGP